MKKAIWLVLAAALISAGCGKGGEKTFKTLADFKGAKVASQRGAVFSQFVDGAIPNVEHLHYDTLSDIMASLSEGKADAVCLDAPVARYIAARNQDLMVFPFPVVEDSYGFAVAKDSELGIKANKALQVIESRGTIRRLKEAWFSADESERALPDLSGRTGFDGSAGTLRYGFEANLVPMSYVGPDGKPAGFDLDIVNRIANHLNMKIEFFPMTFNDLLPKLAAGEVDMVGGNMSITEERLKTFDFVGPYLEGGIVLVIKRNRFGR